MLSTSTLGMLQWECSSCEEIGNQASSVNITLNSMLSCLLMENYSPTTTAFDMLKGNSLEY